MELGRLLDALRSARSAGGSVAGWSIYGTESRRINLGVRDREVGGIHSPLNLSESCGARYLLIWDDGRISRGFLERRQIEADPAAVLSYARAASYDDPDAAWVLGPTAMPEVELHDPGAAAIAAGETSTMTRRLAEVRRQADAHGLRTWSGSFSASESEARLITSEGLEASGRGTTFGWYVTADGEIGDGHAARRPESEEEFDDRLRRLLGYAAWLGEPQCSMASGTHPVILHPRVVEEFVIGTLLHNLEGGTVAHGEGHFRREQFATDQPVLREDLTLRIDPLKPFRSGSYRFTTEGVPAAPCHYIDRGRLVQPIVDLKYARRLGVSPTPLPYGNDSIFFEGSPALSLAEALAAAVGGALILAVLGVHTQDSGSGDFSLSAPQALAIGSSGFVGRLRATVSGNLFGVLADPALRFVSFEGEHTPGLLFPCPLDPK